MKSTAGLQVRRRTAWVAAIALIVGGLPVLAGPETRVRVDFHQARGLLVLDWIKETFGLVVVNPTDFDKPMTLVSAEDVDFPTLLQMLWQSLAPHGYYAFYDAPKKILEVTPIKDIDRSRLRRVEPAQVASLEAGAELGVLTIPFATADVRRLKPLLLDRLNLPPWVEVVPDINASTIHVIAALGDLKKIAAEAKQLDQRAGTLLSTTVIRSIPLKHVRSTQAFRMLADLLSLKVKQESPTPTSSPLPFKRDEKDSSGGRGSFLEDPTKGGGPGGTDPDKDPLKGASASGEYQGVRVQLYRDDASNTLIVMTSRSLIDTIAEFVQQTDVPSIRRGDQPILPHVRSFRINHGNVSEIVQALAGLFEAKYGSAAGGGTPTSPIPTSSDSQKPAQGATLFQGTSTHEGVVRSTIPGKVALIGHYGSNMISILGEEDDLQIAEEFIKDIDKINDQVLIEIMVAEALLTDDRQFGISHTQWNQITGQNTGGGAFSAVADHLTGFESAFAAESSSIIISGEKLRMFMNFLEKDGRTNILSVPKVVALNNKVAMIKFEDIGYTRLVTTETIIPTNGPPQQNEKIEVKDFRTGLSLGVVPRINDNKQVVLKVDLDISEVSGPKEFAETPPPQSSRGIRVISRVNRGDTMVIGGLIKSKVVSTKGKTPFLSDLPLIGNLFSSTIAQNVKAELIIMLTPHLVNDPAQLRTLMEDQREKSPNIKWPVRE